MARKKSLNELVEQVRRIAKANGDLGKLNPTSSRTKQALQIYHRYRKNIEKTKQFRSDWNSSVEQLGNRKYSQNIYMGMANG